MVIHRVQTNDVGLSSKDKHYHFFTSDFTIDGVNFTGLSQVTPSIDKINVSVKRLRSKPRGVQIRYGDSLELLIARDLLKCNGFI
ncbi:hypothetical protein DPMN_038288 [Dreissena polymorpha]|uniref:Uncharacterized protein n=1 Tax=Dreissena polymorpha TaxID=45954 RepID=A0A9D4MF59_DREPO|nr:hypothetical protein DPMN_038288 [Dreissena polymorpha]